ncbi:unnamed protein product [Prorocentrum cordatum]|uniref:Cyclic nucleotide-binding domain-containing protein n=1 Tax=Prorocentrum cordatum TaxID=2364126 RepID=A0ABN9Y5K6_9DINO|nr:unnamed protein product [Polarella glacialis]
MEGLSWGYLYATCLHWSLTQFTPAPMNIQPQNLTERAFTILVVVCALVGFSYVVGRITGSLAQYRALKEEETKLFWDLRVYMKQNHVAHLLAVRIQRYLQKKWRRQAHNKTYQQIKILTMLSEQLENELLFELHASHLTVHPLVQKLLEVSRVTALRVARAAVSTKQLANSDPLFIYGEKPSHMYIVIQGQFRYTRISPQGETGSERVDKGEDWIAEPVMWSTEWYHLGDCTAVEESMLILVSAHDFCKEALRNPAAWILVTTYCKKYLDWLNTADPAELSDITQGEDKNTAMRIKKFMIPEAASSFTILGKTHGTDAHKTTDT